MQPIRVKYYGLIWMTKRTYLVATAIAGAVALMLFLVATALGAIPELKLPWNPALNGKGIAPRIYNVWTLGFLLALQGVDTATVLLKFARKQATRRESPSEEA